jgi:hypothetical protein
MKTISLLKGEHKMSREEELRAIHLRNEEAQQAFDEYYENEELDVKVTKSGIIITSNKVKKYPTYQELRKLSGYSD